MKSDHKIRTRLDAEHAAIKTDPTLAENQFLQGYVQILQLLQGKSASFVEGVTEGVAFVTDDEKD